MFYDQRARVEAELSWPSFSQGTEVAGFIVEGRLDSGSFGTVYRARRGGRPFAIKLVPLDTRGDREVEALRRLRHPNVVGFHGYGFWPHEEPRFLVLALELVDGWPLDVWAREGNPSALELVRQVLLPVTRSLGEVHAAGVVHRDVKESNIVIREADGQPVLVDFGAATYEGAPRLTKRLPPGTPEYRSPEVLRFAREWEGDHYPAGPADDLWALGVTLYCLLTRELPFGDRHGALTLAILQEAPVSPHARNPRVPRVLSGMCLRMLEKAPEARYPDAPSLARALEDAVAQADGTWCEPLFPGPRRELRSAPRAGPFTVRPPPAARGWGRALALAVVLVPFFLVTAFRDDLLEETGGTPRGTSLAATPPQEAGLCREVATPGATGEVGASAEPLTSSAPAPVARATNSEEDAMLKFPRTRSAVSNALLAGTVCMGAACVGGSRLGPPPPTQCPAGAAEAHARFGIRGSWHGVLFSPYDIKVQPVKEGPITATNNGTWEALSGETLFNGRVYFGKERIYVRFTEALLPGGQRAPVCLQVKSDRMLGIEMAPGSTRKTILLYPSVFVEAVDHFD